MHTSKPILLNRYAKTLSNIEAKKIGFMKVNEKEKNVKSDMDKLFKHFPGTVVSSFAYRTGDRKIQPSTRIKVLFFVPRNIVLNGVEKYVISM
jgi:hypothetical protein